MNNNKAIGKLGEDLSVVYLIKHGYKVIDRNYLKKCGEIDIIATKKGIIHFIEVKSVSKNISVIHETSSERLSEYRPEDNMHRNKLKRMRRVVEVYLAEHKIALFQYWQCDLMTVLIDKKLKIGRVFLIKDIII